MSIVEHLALALAERAGHAFKRHLQETVGAMERRAEFVRRGREKRALFEGRVLAL